MSNPGNKTGTLKEKILHELAVYWIYVAYLTLVFVAFTQYRRLILADVGITYTNYFIALIEALIFAKVIMIGDVLKIGRLFEDKPLIVPTFTKTIIFTLLFSAFTFIEHAIRGLWAGSGFMGGIMGFLDKGAHEVLAGALVLFVSLIPFFALRELGRVMGGEHRLLALFFKKRDGQ